ncbi:MAG: hypothetical protein WD076_10795 [Parvularculaceae bacterium]
MGAVVRILVFVVGALGLAMSGLNGYENVNPDAENLLNSLGPASGVAHGMYGLFGTGLEQLGGLLGGVAGGEADADKPNMVAQWGPEGISGLISALLMMFSARR